MKILALDLGKFKTVACLYTRDQHGHDLHEFTTVETFRTDFARLIQQHKADVLVFETCTAAGWLADLCEELDQPYFVANPNGEAWRWSKIKRKTDRDDALKLARLTIMNELPTVHVPARPVRAKRSLLKFRQSIVERRVTLQNEIRALWQAQGFVPMPAGKCGWTKDARATMRKHARPLLECDIENAWRGQLTMLLDQWEYIREQEKLTERKLEHLAKDDASVQRLLTVPGIGRVTAEIIVAYIDDPKRFRNGRQVSSYAGMVPVQYQSGNSDRRGRITKRGSRLLRKALVECGWLMIRYNAWAAETVERISKGQKTRRKQAVVAMSRRMLVRCWAMLRDETDWKQPDRNFDTDKDASPKNARQRSKETTTSGSKT